MNDLQTAEEMLERWKGVDCHCDLRRGFDSFLAVFVVYVVPRLHRVFLSVSCSGTETKFQSSKGAICQLD